MIVIGIYYISLVFSLIVAAIGVYISLKSWMRLKEIELDTLKARAFLDKSFLYRLSQNSIAIVQISIIYPNCENYNQQTSKNFLIRTIAIAIVQCQIVLGQPVYTNFKLTLVVIGLVTLHMIMESTEFEGTLPSQLHPVYYAVFPVAILILVLMIYTWYRLLHMK